MSQEDESKSPVKRRRVLSFAEDALGDSEGEDADLLLEEESYIKQLEKDCNDELY